MTTYISLILGTAFLLAFLIKCNKQRSVAGVYIKNITSIFFILTAVTGAFNNTDYPEVWRYALPLVVGQVFGLMGDVYLDQKWLYPQHDGNYLNLGFTSFGIGHFFYMGAIITQAKFSTAIDFIIPVVVGIVACVVNMLLEKPTKQDYGKFKTITVIYTLVLGTMLGTSLWAAIKTKQVAYIVFNIGAILFLLSDVILSPMYFAIKKNKNTPFNFVIIHVTYYVGQYMIALSPLLLVVN